MPVKKSQYNNPSSDILKLFCLLLFRGEEYSLTQLAGIFNCSKQKIIRMIKVIEAMPLYEDRSPLLTAKRGKENVYCLRKPGRRSPRVALSASELEHLVCCRELVRGIMPRELAQGAESGLNKAATLLENYEDRMVALSPPMQAAVKAQVLYDASGPIISALIEHIKNRQVCLIDYLAIRNDMSREHLAIPVRLLSYGEGLYLRAWMLYKADENDTDSKREGLLAIQRIKGVKAFGRPLSLQEWSKLPSLSRPDIFGLADEVATFTAKIRFSGLAAAYVRERIYSHDQVLTHEDDGGLLWEGTARSETEIIRCVLSCGGEAELLAPAHLRARLAGEAGAVKSRHQNGLNKVAQ